MWGGGKGGTVVAHFRKTFCDKKQSGPKAGERKEASKLLRRELVFPEKAKQNYGQKRKVKQSWGRRPPKKRARIRGTKETWY